MIFELDDDVKERLILDTLNENAYVELTSYDYCPPDIVDEFYRADTRAYHTYTHLLFLVIQLRTYRNILALTDKDMSILIDAIIFHDVIYKVGSDTNEIESVNVYLNYSDSFSQMEKNKRNRACVVDCILSTRTHLPTPSNRLAEIMCDLDMSGFAQERKIHVRMTKLLEYEYTLRYTYKEYIIGRYKFLLDLPQRSCIFHTPELRDIWDQPARTNIFDDLNECRLILNMDPMPISTAKK